MTDALRMAGFAAVAAMLSFTLRAANREAGAAASMAAGLMFFFFALTQITAAVEALRALSERAGIGEQTVTLLLKLVAMAYVTEFAVQSCKDAGEEGLAGKAALCGKMLLMVETLPLITEIGNMTLALIP